MARAVGDQLGDKGRSAGVVVRLVVGHAHDADRVISGGFGLRLGQAGAPGVQAVGQLHNAGAQAPAVHSLVAGQVARQAAAGDVGRRAHRRPLALPRQGVAHHRAVAHGVHVGQAGLLALVHQNGPLEHFKPGILQEGRRRADADGQHDHVGRQHARIGGHPVGFAAAGNAFQRRAGQNAHAFGLQLPFDVPGHLGVKDVRHQLPGHVGDRHVHALRQQVFGHFQADEPAAHHDGAAAAVAVDVIARGDGVVRRAHGEYAGQVFARHVGHKRFRADSQHQLVITGALLRAGIHGPQRHGFGGGVDACGFLPGEHLHAGQARKLLRRVDNQGVARGDAAAQIVGQAAARIGDVAPF